MSKKKAGARVAGASGRRGLLASSFLAVALGAVLAVDRKSVV